MPMGAAELIDGMPNAHPRRPDAQAADRAAEEVAAQRTANAEVGLGQLRRGGRGVCDDELEVDEDLTREAVVCDSDVVPLAIGEVSAAHAMRAARRAAHGHVERAERVDDAVEAKQAQAVLVQWRPCGVADALGDHAPAHNAAVGAAKRQLCIILLKPASLTGPPAALATAGSAAAVPAARFTRARFTRQIT